MCDHARPLGSQPKRKTFEITTSEQSMDVRDAGVVVETDSVAVRIRASPWML